MFPGMNPAKIQGMMKKMGISQTPLNVNRVIFEMEDGNLVIDEPSVMRVMMQGQETYQVSGEAKSPRDDSSKDDPVGPSGEPEETEEKFSEEDVAMVVEKTGKSEEEVKNFLDENDGDIALAIVELKKGE